MTKDLGNYVLSGTLHVTLSPEEAKNIQWQERAVDEAIEKTTALMPEVTEQASRLVQQREDIGMEEDELGKLDRQNEDLRRMVARIKAARGPIGIFAYTHVRTHTHAQSTLTHESALTRARVHTRHATVCSSMCILILCDASAGPTGAPGPVGIRGAPGPMGAPPPVPAPGPPGARGKTGLTGIAGPTGFVGQRGAIGPVGPEGQTAKDGLVGKPGLNGHDGWFPSSSLVAPRPVWVDALCVAPLPPRWGSLVLLPLLPSGGGYLCAH